MLVSIILGSVFALEVLHSRDAFRTDHAREMMRIAVEALLSVGDRDAATSGARFSHDGSPLDAARATSELTARLDSLVALTVNNPRQHARAVLASEAAVHHGRYPAAIVDTVQAPLDASGLVGIQLRNDAPLRARLSEFLTIEEGLYRSRMTRQERVRLLLPSSVLLEVLVVLLALARVRRKLVEQTDSLLTQSRNVVTQNEVLGQQNEELRQQTYQLAEQGIELEERQAELESSLEGVRTERERFEALLSSMTDSVYTLDIDARMNYLSPTVQGRWAHATLVGQTPMDGFGSDSADAHAAACRSALGNVPVTFEWQYELDGSHQYFSTAIAPLHDAAGAVCGAVGVTRDRTAEHQREVALVETETRLHHAQKLEAVGQLAGGVAHDFNNLLTVIIAYADMLSMERAEGDEDRIALGEIGNAARRAAELTKQLLAFSRREGAATRVIDMCDTIRGVELLLRKMVDSDVTFELDIPDDPCPVSADSGQLGQVIMNLVVNANAAMPAGGSLRIATTRIELDDTFVTRHVGICSGPHVSLCVTDTGEGMTEVVLERIFEPFFTTKAPGKGTGLGLATVYGIVQNWGGCIDVASAPGRGSSFCVYLPLASMPAEDAEPRTLPIGAVHDPVSAVERARPAAVAILLVDDETAIRGVVGRILRGADFHVIEAGNGAEALRSLEEDASIRCVLSDMVMPVMGGRELAYEVRVRYPNVALVLMSGFTRNALAADDPLRNEVFFLEKPFTTDALLEAVTGAVRVEGQPLPVARRAILQ